MAGCRRKGCTVNESQRQANKDGTHTTYPVYYRGMHDDTTHRDPPVVYHFIRHKSMEVLTTE